ncbi:MAG: hypothetical protein WC606_02630 [Candidatus Absconditabacterales bacterium]
MTEKIIETKACKHCGTAFDITDKDMEFYNKISPSFPLSEGEGGGVRKYSIPTPILCPDCRQQRRLSWRNERKLYRRTCDASGKQIICLYSPDKDVKVYHYNERWNDKLDFTSYGKDFDLNKSFFKQFEELLHQVPRISTFNKMTENTEYGNNLIGDKDCYMLFITFSNENCYYGYTVSSCKNCVDMLWSVENQNCYEGVNVQNCYECFYCVETKNSVNGYYLHDCIRVKNSAFCIGLRDKQYCFLNKVYDKAQFEEIQHRLFADTDFLQKTKKDFEQLKLKTPVRASFVEQSENCSGDYIHNSKNCHASFNVMLGEDCKYCYDCFGALASMDVYLGGNESPETPSQLVYECENSFNIFNVGFSSTVTYASNDVWYSDNCDSCVHCFGCIGLHHKEYCILNKQYTKEEYEKFIPQIIEKMKIVGERGEFFPTSISLFGYNETEANSYYPLSKEEIIAKGWNRYDESHKTKISDGIRQVYAKDLPVDITDVDDSILDKIVICEITGKPFRIIKQELEFYRKYSIPLPKRCPDQRHIERMQLRHARKIRDRTCAKCGKNIKTTYSPERPEIVYCEVCYNKEIYG